MAIRPARERMAKPSSDVKRRRTGLDGEGTLLGQVQAMPPLAPASPESIPAICIVATYYPRDVFLIVPSPMAPEFLTSKATSMSSAR